MILNGFKMSKLFSRKTILENIKLLENDLNLDLCYDSFVKNDLPKYFYYESSGPDLTIFFETEKGSSWIKLKNFLQDNEEIFYSKNIENFI